MVTVEEETKKKILSANDILSADDITNSLIEVEVPEWGGTVMFRPMTAAECILWNQKLSGPGKNEAWLSIFASCAVDENGQRLFTPKQLDDLRKKNVRVFFRLQHELMRLNGMGRGEKTWEKLLPILEAAEVDPATIKLIERNWTAPEDEAKNA